LKRTSNSTHPIKGKRGGVMVVRIVEGAPLSEKEADLAAKPTRAAPVDWNGQGKSLGGGKTGQINSTWSGEG